jgi:hypothetical protein
LTIDYIGQNKIAAKWLLEYPERRQSYIDQLSEFSVLGAMKYSSQPGGTDPGDPTKNKGVSLATLDEQRLWIMTIEETESTLGEKKLVFMDIRRQAENIKYEGDMERGRPPWMLYVQSHYADWHQRRYGVYYEPSRKTIFNWWYEIINIAVRIAIKRGCL